MLRCGIHERLHLVARDSGRFKLHVGQFAAELVLHGQPAELRRVQDTSCARAPARPSPIPGCCPRGADERPGRLTFLTAISRAALRACAPSPGSLHGPNCGHGASGEAKVLLLLQAGQHVHSSRAIATLQSGTRPTRVLPPGEEQPCNVDEVPHQAQAPSAPRAHQARTLQVSNPPPASELPHERERVRAHPRERKPPTAPACRRRLCRW